MKIGMACTALIVLLGQQPHMTEERPLGVESNAVCDHRVLERVGFHLEGWPFCAAITQAIPVTTLAPGERLAARLEGRFRTLQCLLDHGRWAAGSRATWDILHAVGDDDGDGVLSHTEHDALPCVTLGRLASMWKASLGASGGYDDILIPRFRKRFVSCHLWER